LPGLADLADDARERLVAQLEYLETAADLVIVDTGAGVGRNVMDFVAAADDVVVVATPEPTSITDAYAAIKVLSREADYGNVFVLMNMVSGGGEAGRIANQIIRVSRDFLGLCVEYGGYIVRDESVSAAVRARRPFILAYPGSQASHCLRRTLEVLEIQRRRGERRRKGGFFRRLFCAFRPGAE
jgi:flagellar biosynthesis protein FlhG